MVFSPKISYAIYFITIPRKKKVKTLILLLFGRGTDGLVWRIAASDGFFEFLC